jgi:basic amino acid/polyamine antiporter, APA family
MQNISSKVSLSRSLGLKLAVVVVIGNILGSGVYKKVAPMAAELDSAVLVLLCWVLGGIITLFGALSNAEIAGMLADTGGEVVYYRRIYNRFISFIYGWANFAIIKTASIASLAYVFAMSVHSMAPLPEVLPALAQVNIAGVFHPFAGFNVKLLAIGLILALTLFNTFGIKKGMHLSTILLLLVITGILLITVFGLTAPQSDVSQVFAVTPTTRATGLGAIFTAMLAAFWAYEGWNSVGFVAGEIKNPNKNVPLALMLGLFGVIAIYLLVNTAYLSLLSTEQLTSIYQSANQIAAVEAVHAFGGTTGALVISLLILITTLGCTHASIISNSRIYFALAGRNMFFKPVAKVNKAKVPVGSLWFQGGWASLLVMSGTFDQLTDTLIFAAFIFYGITTLGVFVMRFREPLLYRPYKVWGYPIIPGFFVLFCAALTINTIMSRPREAAIGLTLIAIGVPFYYYFRKRMKDDNTNTDQKSPNP